MRLTSIVAMLASAVGCTPRSDSEYALHQHRTAAERTLRNMRASTQQAAPAMPLAGDELERTISGKTLVTHYERLPSGMFLAYKDYRHFARDHRYVRSFSEGLGEQDSGHWSVRGSSLCIIGRQDRDASCYFVVRDALGQLQLRIDAPDGPYHGLLSIVTDAILDGPPPEDVAAPSR